MRRETRFPYDRYVADGVVDRQAWAVVVRELLDVEAMPLVEGGKRRVHGAKTRFAAKAGVTPRTVDTWLEAQVDVKEINVRRVAKGYDISPMDLLIRVGFYSVEEIPIRLPDEVVDEEQRAVLDDPTIPDEAKVLILQELDTWRARDEQIIEAQRERDRQLRLERIKARLEKARQDHVG